MLNYHNNIVFVRERTYNIYNTVNTYRYIYYYILVYLYTQYLKRSYVFIKDVTFRKYEKIVNLPCIGIIRFLLTDLTKLQFVLVGFTRGKNV